ncbi:MAG: hypothetical protein LAO55_23805 [Acidobacteriia bacterium]|nr:hypothetical protein [Terriglobia bacterium]
MTLPAMLVALGLCLPAQSASKGSAIDADTGGVRWKSPTPGSVLWRNSTGAALGGGVITYRTGEHQRVAVAAGMSPANRPLPKTTWARDRV